VLSQHQQPGHGYPGRVPDHTGSSPAGTSPVIAPPDAYERRWPSAHDGSSRFAYRDFRPIFGGKVVIQAKRCKNTVGVSAVRDLFGTLQKEGASKGILVTTSGYGQASFDFAQNKPIELIDGANLLYLLSEHAGIEAKIMPPEDWKDPAADTPEFS
jgi:restriction system protein